MAYPSSTSRTRRRRVHVQFSTSGNSAMTTDFPLPPTAVTCISGHNSDACISVRRRNAIEVLQNPVLTDIQASLLCPEIHVTAVGGNGKSVVIAELPEVENCTCTRRRRVRDVEDGYAIHEEEVRTKDECIRNRDVEKHSSQVHWRRTLECWQSGICQSDRPEAAAAVGDERVRVFDHHILRVARGVDAADYARRGCFTHVDDLNACTSHRDNSQRIADINPRRPRLRCGRTDDVRSRWDGYIDDLKSSGAIGDEHEVASRPHVVCEARRVNRSD